MLKKIGKPDLARSIQAQAESMLKSDTTHAADYIRLLLEKDGPDANAQALKLAQLEVKTRAGFESMHLLSQACMKNQRPDLAREVRKEMRKKGMVVEND